MEEMLVRILNIARRRDHDPALSHLAFKFMYLLTKARGLKTVVRLLPHEVVDLEPVLNYIYQQDATDYEVIFENTKNLLLIMPYFQTSCLMVTTSPRHGFWHQTCFVLYCLFFYLMV